MTVETKTSEEVVSTNVSTVGADEVIDSVTAEAVVEAEKVKPEISTGELVKLCAKNIISYFSKKIKEDSTYIEKLTTKPMFGCAGPIIVRVSDVTTEKNKMNSTTRFFKDVYNIHVGDEVVGFRISSQFVTHTSYKKALNSFFELGLMSEATYNLYSEKNKEYLAFFESKKVSGKKPRKSHETVVIDIDDNIDAI